MKAAGELKEKIRITELAKQLEARLKKAARVVTSPSKRSRGDTSKISFVTGVSGLSNSSTNKTHF